MPQRPLWAPLVKPNAPSEDMGECLRSREKVPAETQRGQQLPCEGRGSSNGGPTPHVLTEQPPGGRRGWETSFCLLASTPTPHQSLLDRSAYQRWDRRVPLKLYFLTHPQRNSSRTNWAGREARTLRTEAGLPVDARAQASPHPSRWQLLRRGFRASGLGCPRSLDRAGPSPRVPPSCQWVGRAPHRGWGASGNPRTPFKVPCSRRLLRSWSDGTSLVLH